MTRKGDSKRPSLLFLTNLYNDGVEEDLYLTERLREWFDIAVAHPLDCESFEDGFDLLLARNVWPTHVFGSEKKTALIRRLIHKGLIPMSEAERGYLEHDRYLEKEYLLDLFGRGYPVIPSVDTLAAIDQLGNHEEYFLKPKDLCDGEGTERLAKEQLLKKDGVQDMLIQPFIDFDYEICFYFIDGEFVYAFSTRNRTQGDKREEYMPTEEDMRFAQQFVDWNNLSFGLQRVDAVRVRGTHELLLTELEDFGPYLYLLDLPEHVQDKAVLALKESLMRRLGA